MKAIIAAAALAAVAIASDRQRRRRPSAPPRTKVTCTMPSTITASANMGPLGAAEPHSRPKRRAEPIVWKQFDGLRSRSRAVLLFP